MAIASSALARACRRAGQKDGVMGDTLTHLLRTKHMWVTWLSVLHCALRQRGGGRALPCSIDGYKNVLPAEDNNICPGGVASNRSTIDDFPSHGRSSRCAGHSPVNGSSGFCWDQRGATEVGRVREAGWFLCTW